MGLIHTCELCGANPFDYLTEVQRHAEEVASAPGDWLPWNYRDKLTAAIRQHRVSATASGLRTNCSVAGRTRTVASRRALAAGQALVWMPFPHGEFNALERASPLALPEAVAHSPNRATPP
jgi:hypothetical protein